MSTFRTILLSEGAGSGGRGLLGAAGRWFADCGIRETLANTLLLTEHKMDKFEYGIQGKKKLKCCKKEITIKI